MREKRRLFFKGGVQAEITGLGRERFFNIAARREIFVTGIGTDRDGRVLFWTTVEDYKKFVASVKEKSLYQTGTTAKYRDKLLTLSTCEYSQKNGRMVLVAKKNNGKE